MTTNEKGVIIEKFLDDTLDTEERQTVISILSDPAFRHELLVQAQIVDSLQDIDSEDIKRYLRS